MSDTAQLPTWAGDTARLPDGVIVLHEASLPPVARPAATLIEMKLLTEPTPAPRRIGCQPLLLLAAGALIWPVVSNVVYWTGVLIGGGR